MSDTKSLLAVLKFNPMHLLTYWVLLTDVVACLGKGGGVGILKSHKELFGVYVFK